MKSVKIIVIVVLLIVGLFKTFKFYGQENNKIETVLFDCLTSSFHEIEVDLNKELDEFENYLIDKGILSSSSGQSYYEFYEQVAEINDIKSKIDIDRFHNLIKLRPNEYYSNICLQNMTEIDSVEIIKSKYHQLMLTMQDVASKNEVSPSSVANAIISVLTASDFEKPYYKAIALLTILNTSNIESGLLTKMKPIKSVDFSNHQSFLILANSQSEIIYNNRILTEQQLKTELYDFIKQYQENHQIVFSSERGTSYDFYLKVQKYIFEIYTTLRDEKSNELYKKSFSDLKESEKERVIRIYPKNIKEQ